MPDFVNNLLSMGVFCDADCSVTFTKTDVAIYDAQGTIILRGFRESDGARMWRVSLTNANANMATVVVPRSPAHIVNSRSDTYHRKSYDLPSIGALIQYHHASLGYPVKSELLKAIKCGHLRSFPGLSYTNASRYCPEAATPTVMGHITQVPKGVRSTKPQQVIQHLPPLLPEFQPALTELLVYTVALNTIFTDDMGRFPVTSFSGNNYIMLAHHVGANAILIEPFKSKADTHRIPAYNAIMERFKARGLHVNLQILDNEASAAYIECITNKWKCQHQKVPPDMHRRNIAERMIRTFKAHLLSILAGVDPLFPVRRWDLLLVQAELTINLLRTSRIDPSKSAWEVMCGPFNYDATPLGPPGCRIIAHAKGATHRSWDFRGIEGFYIGPALNH